MFAKDYHRQAETVDSNKWFFKKLFLPIFRVEAMDRFENIKQLYSLTESKLTMGYAENTFLLCVKSSELESRYNHTEREQ